MDDSPAPDAIHVPRFDHGLPLLWPFAAAVELGARGAKIIEDNLRFVAEAAVVDHPPLPDWATPNRVLLDLDTMRARDFGTGRAPTAVPVLIDAPYAGHSATIADYRDGQSLVQVLKGVGIDRVLVTDWKAATPEMKGFDIDKYLAEINVLVDDLGGRVHLIGLCQGGWMGAMFAARHPVKVASLVLAGAPIDTAAGHGVLHDMVRALPASFLVEMVALGQGVMRGEFMLAGWKNMHPDEQYLRKYLDLYAHIEDRNYLQRTEAFERWYEHPIDLPGRYYLQTIDQIFRRNALAEGRFVALGRVIDLRAIRVPVFLLAGERDDITPPEQVFAARGLVGTRDQDVVQRLVPGGHIGLFMGSQALAGVWPDIGRWILANGG